MPRKLKMTKSAIAARRRYRAKKRGGNMGTAARRMTRKSLSQVRRKVGAKNYNLMVGQLSKKNRRTLGL